MSRYTSLLHLLPSGSVFKTKSREIHCGTTTFSVMIRLKYQVCNCNHQLPYCLQHDLTQAESSNLVFISNFNYLPISCNHIRRYTSFIPHICTSFLILLRSGSIYVCSNQISITHCGGRMYSGHDPRKISLLSSLNYHKPWQRLLLMDLYIMKFVLIWHIP